jgi:hypothetical protein
MEGKELRESGGPTQGVEGKESTESGRAAKGVGGKEPGKSEGDMAEILSRECREKAEGRQGLEKT